MARPKGRMPADVRMNKPVASSKMCRRCNKELPIEAFLYGGMYREMCANHYKEYRRRWNEKHKEKLRAWHLENDKKRAGSQLFKQHERVSDAKWTAFVHYSGDPPSCQCCGEDAFEFLCMDHINGGGEQHRKEVGAGIKLYRWLIREGFPDGFRVLCHNCNSAFGFYGYCPHVEEECSSSR